MIHCRLLGPAEVTSEGGPVPRELLWNKNLALLIYLARSPRRGRSRDHLAGLLWPDSAKAGHSLSEALRHLRRALGDGGVDSDQAQIRLSATALEMDIDSFANLTAAGRWREAAALVDGEFLQDFSVPDASDFEDWLRHEREVWRVRSVEALVHAAEEALESGNLEEALDLGGRALRLDSVAEAASRVCMRTQALAGQRALALAEFDQLTVALQKTSRREPEPETRALAERIRRSRRWNLGQEATTARERSRRGPLVARETELSSLLEAWSVCRDQSRATLAIIEGDSGTGKTRLLEELVERARLDRATVTAIRVVEADRAEPCATLLGLCRSGLLDAPGLAAASPQALGALAAWLPDLAGRFGPIGLRESSTLIRAMSEVLVALGEEQPVLLAADDVSWADRDSVLALGAWLRDAAKAPLFIVVTTSGLPQRDEVDDLRVRIPRDVPGVVIRLDPLPVSGIHLLARWALPRFNEEELERITRRVAMDSAGLPLLAVELLHAVALGLDLNEIDGAWPRPLRTLSDSFPGDLPDAVRAAIRIGFRRLTPAAQQVLVAAAVIGDRVPADVLGRGSGVSEAVLLESLDTLEWQRWLSAESRGYSFVARIARDVVAADMVTPGQRARILKAASSPPQP